MTLVAAGAAVALSQRGRIGPFVIAVLTAAAVAPGIGLLVAPRLRFARAQAEAERRERIRAEERERVASRLHDSVLQSLALIQREDDPERARRLARRQDRELRAWLYGDEDPAARETTFAGALRAAVADVEEAYGVRVDLVQPADAPMDAALEALVDATREAVTNAAKHSGTHEVSVMVRVQPGRVSTFVRDRGVGFDPRSAAPDRRGLRDSMRARLARVGGAVVIDSVPGEGADVELWVPRESPGT